jgi:20S proteasome alpha/beta subunit
MKSLIRKVLKEELTTSDKSEIKDIFNKEFDKKLKSSDLKDVIEKIVLKQLGDDKKTKKEVAKITQKVLIQVFKTFWVRRNFWSNNLENVS